MNRFTLKYTVFGGSLQQPQHLVCQFESDGELLQALDDKACEIFQQIKQRYGEDSDIILREISHDNAKVWYNRLVSETRKENKSL